MGAHDDHALEIHNMCKDAASTQLTSAASVVVFHIPPRQEWQQLHLRAHP